MAMLLYFVVVIVSVFSVLLEMDVLVEPAQKIERASITQMMTRPAPPPAQAKAAPLRHKPEGGKLAAQQPVNPVNTAATPQPVKAAATPATPATAALATAPAAATTVNAMASNNRAAANGSLTAPAKPIVADMNAAEVKAADKPVALAVQALDKPASERCDVIACASAYHSFRESDCTYLPSSGPRRLCTKGTPPEAAAAAAKADVATTASEPTTAADKPVEPQAADKAPDAAVQAPAKPAVSNRCDIDACSRAYHTFNPADCTFALRIGVRRLCTKGTPPAAAAAKAEETLKTADAAKPTEAAKATDAAKPTEPPKASDVHAAALCNVRACAEHYISFDARACTYQPSVGPRRLCTRN